jgi:hypothetical protein
LSGVTFPEDYAAVLRKIRADYVKQQAAQQWQDQIAILQKMIDKIDVSLSATEAMVKAPAPKPLDPTAASAPTQQPAAP